MNAVKWLYKSCPRCKFGDLALVQNEFLEWIFECLQCTAKIPAVMRGKKDAKLSD